MATDNCGGYRLTDSLNGGSTLSGYRFVIPINLPHQQTVYWEAVDSSGNKSTCVVVAELQVDVTIHPMTAFSPNGDEINDTWKVENIELYRRPL